MECPGVTGAWSDRGYIGVQVVHRGYMGVQRGTGVTEGCGVGGGAWIT